MSKVGELSKDNIKILADERTNALIIMASKGDMATLHEIIKDMDLETAKSRNAREMAEIEAKIKAATDPKYRT